jgi:transposase, IS30 family
MSYHQLTSTERYTITVLRAQGFTPTEIAEILGRHRSTIYRELSRNRCPDGYYRLGKAIKRTNGRRRRAHQSRCIGDTEFALVKKYLRKQWSPVQIAMRLYYEGRLVISHETIYRFIRLDKQRGGTLYLHLRQSQKQKRKRYKTADSRGVLAGKRPISERPQHVENREELGHWEIDTVMGGRSKDCIVTLVERKSGHVLIGKLRNRTKEELNKRVIKMIQGSELTFTSITADNGTEFHGYKEIEQATGVKFYFATPYHSWERGTNENTNGLIRQYLPKRKCMASLTQSQCDNIAHTLNTRPRERHDFRTPLEVCQGLPSVALQM